jgi:hypothetical protein
MYLWYIWMNNDKLFGIMNEWFFLFLYFKFWVGGKVEIYKSTFIPYRTQD